MLKKPHSSHSQKWESSKKDVEGKQYGREGSVKEEAFDQKQMPKLPMKK
jgi:hypothetical protein